MCMNPVNEELDRAYSNVGLLASDVWNFQEVDDGYKKANLNLWIRFNETEKRLVEDDCDDVLSSVTDEVRTVRDILPYSRLASYNDYPYSEERERMYNENYEPAEYLECSFNPEQEYLEAWMLPEVEEKFKWLTKVSTSRWNSTSPRHHMSLTPACSIMATCPLQWLSQTAWPAQLLSRYPDLPRTLQDSRSLSFYWQDVLGTCDISEVEEKLEEFPCPRYLIETNADLELHTRIDTEAIRNLWTLCYDDFDLGVALNAEVPEFQPVIVRQLPPPYPPVFDESYQAEVFPYSCGYIQPVPEPSVVYPDEHQTIQDVPKPLQSYFNVEAITPGWRKPVMSNLVQLNQPTDQSNLVDRPESSDSCSLLATIGSTDTHDYSAQKMPNTEQILAALEKWVNKIYKRRASDFSTLSSTSCRIDQIFQNVHQHYTLMQEVPPPNVMLSPQRPLYSDVLMNEASVTASDSKFDQLEQEALEQYSGSDTILRDKLYQDLEQEAVAQYQQTQTRPQPSFWDPRPPIKETKRRVRLDDQSPRYSPRSINSNSPSFGSKRSSIEENLDICCPKKQAIWIKKKKKKQEKKKKCSKNKKKLPQKEYNNKYIETEILMIDKFCLLKNHFKVFTKGEWMLVHSLLAEDVSNQFKACLNMVTECLNWFVEILTSAVLKQDYRSNKKRLELSRSIVDTLYDLMNLLNQYIVYFSKIKMTIPFDHRLNNMLSRTSSHFSLLSCELYLCEDLGILDECCQRVELFSEASTGKNLKRLISCMIPQQSFVITGDLTWKLTMPAYDTLSHSRYSCVHMASGERSYRLILVSREGMTSSKTHKLVKMIDEFQVWCSYQWRFPDGWDFGNNQVQIYDSLHWTSRLTVSALENIKYVAWTSLMTDWLLDFIGSQHIRDFGYQLLWDARRDNQISWKLGFTKLLLWWEEGWTLGEIRTNQQGCLPWTISCEKTCYVNWVLGNSSTPQATPSTNNTEMSLCKSEHNKEESKVKGKRSKDKMKLLDRPSPERQLVIANRQTNVTPEKPGLSQHSSCSVQ
ncbi:uncharacterized protein LOC124366897 isoform X2 [Homalodisca vitripennis]|uniref:uncharacterized protein LOC124366897 isoform X2 n=1 Tax=Homalodisca vitripennis TaxID=197043 RepID=UPI001EEC9C0E|nr:uncharacterized protein LOC124366897 isoform X2 [Homalodisca vitripennis]